MASDRIVVGVDATASARAALIWAIDECRFRNCSLLVTHAPDRADAFVAQTNGEAGLRAVEDLGGRLLRELVILASARQPGVPVSSVLSHAPAAETLIDLSALSAMVVVGRRPRGGTTLSLLGSVADRVAAHANCPVAVVPMDHYLGAEPTGGPVVVGAADSRAGHAAIQFAVEEAAYRNVSVRAVRAFDAPSEAGEALPEEMATQHRRVARRLDRELADAVRDHGDVPVERLLLSGDPGELLLTMSGDADLVVIGCHHSDDRWSTRLGQVPSTLLNQIRRPLVIVGTSMDRATGYPPPPPQEAEGVWSHDVDQMTIGYSIGHNVKGR